MPISIQPIPPHRLPDYATIPSLCHVHSILTPSDPNHSPADLTLHEQPIPTPYEKNYDTTPEGNPTRWPQLFDLTNWSLFLATDQQHPVGAAAVAFNTPILDLLEGKSDIALLWDIRVRQSHQHQGIGTALFHNAAQCARSKNCRLLKIETQNTNLPACRFYARMNCHLAQITPHAYTHHPDLAHEIMLVWHLDLSLPSPPVSV